MTPVEIGLSKTENVISGPRSDSRLWSPPWWPRAYRIYISVLAGVAIGTGTIAASGLAIGEENNKLALAVVLGMVTTGYTALNIIKLSMEEAPPLTRN